MRGLPALSDPVSKDRLPGSNGLTRMLRWRRGNEEYSFFVGHPGKKQVEKTGDRQEDYLHIHGS
jgi:hypothetical protein